MVNETGSDGNGGLPPVDAQEQPFRLVNRRERKVMRVENVQGEQGKLFTGLDCLPGQEELFDPAEYRRKESDHGDIPFDGL